MGAMASRYVSMWDVAPVVVPWLLGVIVESALVGLLINQTANYYIKHWMDATFNKLIVAILTSISLGYWIFIVLTCRSATPLMIRDNPIGPYIAIAPYVTFFVSALSAGFNQWFFAKRTFELYNRSKILAALFGFLILAPAFAVIPGVARNDKFPFESGYIVGYLFTTAFTNTVITGTLVWKVMTMPRRVTPKSDRLIHRLLFLTLSTAFISTFFELTSAILFITTFKSNYASVAFLLQLPQIYSLAVVGSLNLRRVILADGKKSTLHGHPSPNPRRPHQVQIEGDPNHRGHTTPASGQRGGTEIKNEQQADGSNGTSAEPAHSSNTAFDGNCSLSNPSDEESRVGEGIRSETGRDLGSLTSTSIMTDSRVGPIKAFSQRYTGLETPPQFSNLLPANENDVTAPDTLNFVSLPVLYEKVTTPGGEEKGEGSSFPTDESSRAQSSLEKTT